MMIVKIFDLSCAQPIGNSKFHGGGEYTKTIFRDYVLSQKDETIVACYNHSLFIDEWMLALFSEHNVITENVTNKKDIENVVSKYAKEQGNNVCFYAGMAYGYENITFPKNVKAIGTFHGLRMIEKPIDSNIIYYLQSKNDLKTLFLNLFCKKYITNKIRLSYLDSMKKFDYIITVSEYSKHSILVNFPEIESQKVHRMYPPLKYSGINNSTNNQVPTNNTDENYIMMVSGNRWLKNAARGVKAIDSLYSKGLLKNYKTIIFGGLPKRVYSKIENKDLFEIKGYAKDEEFENAYKRCSIFFYPTLNEGFGSPPLEAMKYGKTCVVSGVCSLTEVYGDSVYYCNPYDYQELENKILQAIRNRIPDEVISRRVKWITNQQEKDLAQLINLIRA